MELGSWGDRRRKSFPTRAALRSIIEADLSDLVEHCLVADLQQAGSLRAVPPDLLQDLLDHRLLGRHRGAARDILEAELSLRRLEGHGARWRGSLCLGGPSLLAPEGDLLLHESL